MTISTNYENTRPKVCAFFAGRVWYAGVESGQKNGWVLFSQVATDIDKFAKCYQEGDPTSEVFSDIKDDDGGVIPIQDAGEIVDLKPLGSSMVVFATNGIWQIIGGDTGFKATSYSVQKITAAGCSGPKTPVEVDDYIMYWSNNGVMLLQVTQTGEAAAKNITEMTIDSFYQAIPVTNRYYAQGAYNQSDKVVWWAYNKATSGAVSYRKNRILAYDVRLGAWYSYDISEGSVIPVSLAATTVTKQNVESLDVYVGTDVVDVSGLTVVADVPVLNASSQEFKLMTLVSDASVWKLTWSDMSNESYKDWGVDAPAYMITGYSMGTTGPSKAKTLGYIHAYMKRCPIALDANALPTKEASVKLQTRADFTDNAVADKWSQEYEVYRNLRPYFSEPSVTIENGYPLVITKNKVRGRGKAFQMKWSSAPAKEMKLVGWSVTLVENTNV